MTESDFKYAPEKDIAALERNAAHDAWRVDGVVGPKNRLLQILCLKGYPKARVWRDRSGAIHVDLRIVARFGTHLGVLGSTVHDAVHEGIRHVVDVPINNIHVRVVRVVAPETLEHKAEQGKAS